MTEFWRPRGIGCTRIIAVMKSKIYSIFLHGVFSESEMNKLDVLCCSATLWQQDLSLSQTEAQRYASSHHMGPNAQRAQVKGEMENLRVVKENVFLSGGTNFVSCA